MEMKRYKAESEGKKVDGYWIVLSPGQQKKWPYLPVELMVDGVIVTDKEKDTSFSLITEEELYEVVTGWESGVFKVTMAHEDSPVLQIEKEYRTHLVHDNIIRMLLELHNNVQKEVAAENFTKKVDFNTWCKLKYGMDEDATEQHLNKMCEAETKNPDLDPEEFQDFTGYYYNELDNWNEYLQGKQELPDNYRVPFTQRTYYEESEGDA